MPVIANNRKRAKIRPMYRIAALSFLVVIITGHLAYCEQKPCTPAEHIQVESEAATLRSWDTLYKSYRKYRHCDDVDAHEGYSESIARILVDHWETLPRLAQLIKADKSFGRFVGLDATMAMNDVAKIKTNAQKHCPADLARLCGKLNRDADEAIAEDSSAHKEP